MQLCDGYLTTGKHYIFSFIHTTPPLKHTTANNMMLPLKEKIFSDSFPFFYVIYYIMLYYIIHELNLHIIHIHTNRIK